MTDKWTAPDWIKPYMPLICNTGGNAIESLMNDHESTVQVHPIRAALIVSVHSQITLLHTLKEKGLLKDTSMDNEQIQNAFAQGMKDGLTLQPFTSGITYPEPRLNEAYDHGVNVGQATVFLTQQG